MVVVEEAEARAAATGAPAPDVAAQSVAAAADPGPPLFELKNISKRFPGVIALDDVSLQIRAGEVHVLLGENGAGKSSLMKILCGAYTADTGEFFHQGEKVTVSSPADARRYGSR